MDTIISWADMSRPMFLGRGALLMTRHRWSIPILFVALSTQAILAPWPDSTWRWLSPRAAGDTAVVLDRTGSMTLAWLGRDVSRGIWRYAGDLGLVAVSTLLAVGWWALLASGRSEHWMPLCLALALLSWIQPAFAPGGAAFALLASALLVRSAAIRGRKARLAILFAIEAAWIQLDPWAALGIVLIVARGIGNVLDRGRSAPVDRLDNLVLNPAAVLLGALATLRPIAGLTQAFGYLLMPLSEHGMAQTFLADYVSPAQANPLAAIAMLLAAALVLYHRLDAAGFCQTALLLAPAICLGLASKRDLPLALGWIVTLAFLPAGHSRAASRIELGQTVAPNRAESASHSQTSKRHWAPAGLVVASLVAGLLGLPILRGQSPGWLAPNGESNIARSVSSLLASGAQGAAMVFPLDEAARAETLSEGRFQVLFATADMDGMRALTAYDQTIRQLRSEQELPATVKPKPVALVWSVQDLWGVSQLATSTQWRPVDWNTQYVTFLNAKSQSGGLFQAAATRVRSLDIEPYLSENPNAGVEGRPIDEVLFGLRLSLQALKVAQARTGSGQSSTAWTSLYYQSLAHQDRQLSGMTNPLWQPMALRQMRSAEGLTALPPALAMALADFAADQGYYDVAAQAYGTIAKSSTTADAIATEASRAAADMQRRRDRLDTALHRLADKSPSAKAQRCWADGFPLAARETLAQAELDGAAQRLWSERFLEIGMPLELDAPSKEPVDLAAWREALAALDQARPQAAADSLRAALDSSAELSSSQRERLAYALLSVSLLTGSQADRAMATKIIDRSANQALQSLASYYSQWTLGGSP